MQNDGPGLKSDALPDAHEDGQASPAAQRARDDAREIESSVQDPARFGILFDRYFAEIHGYAASRLGRDAAIRPVDQCHPADSRQLSTTCSVRHGAGRVTDAASFGPRLICGGILLGVELDLVVSS